MKKRFDQTGLTLSWSPFLVFLSTVCMSNLVLSLNIGMYCTYIGIYCMYIGMYCMYIGMYCMYIHLSEPLVCMQATSYSDIFISSLTGHLRVK